MTSATPWPSGPPTAAERASFAGARRRSFWLDDLAPRDAEPRLLDSVDAELCIVGGGFTGLWAALHAVRREPDRSVVVLEADRCGEGASGRNGGFLSSSLTHGLGNGLARFADELEELERLGMENFRALAADLEAYGIDAEYEATGQLTVAMAPHELPWLDEEAALMRNFGIDAEALDRDAVRAEVDSPLYLGGLWQRDGEALVHPGKLADGLRRAALAAGVIVHEHSPAIGLRSEGSRVRVRTRDGEVRARRVLLATSAYPGLVAPLRRAIAPVYDYVIVTRPLTSAQWQSIGWARRQGLADMANRFHYYRPTRDGRILFGGYEAVYRYGGPVADRLDDDPATFGTLAQHLLALFPSLAGLGFSHAWGGAIDTCSRFTVFFGLAHAGRVGWAAGYTGLGVGASRWGAEVALDLLDGRDTPATRLRFTRARPLPFPPEPLRAAAIGLTRNRLAAADRREGRRGAWLRTLDRLGLGFDS